jgi:hypothetical protein
MAFMQGSDEARLRPRARPARPGAPRRDAVAVRDQCGPALEREFDRGGPGEDHEQVSIGNREQLAHQVGSAVAQGLGQRLEPPRELVGCGLLEIVGRRVAEQRSEQLVDLARDVAEMFLQVIARHRAGGWREPRAGVAIRDVLHDGWALGEALAIVELERRHVALGVDGPEVPAVAGPVRREINDRRLERESGFAQRNVR